jgi:uncharacterized protein (UPF0335 family)
MMEKLITGDMDEIGGNTAKVLSDAITNIEEAESERQELADGIKAVMADLKAKGFNPRAVKELLWARKKDTPDYREQVRLARFYGNAIGWQASFWNDDEEERP